MRWSVRAALLLLLLSPETTLAQPVVTNVGIDASLGFLLEDGFVAIRSSEARSGMTDFNGDGDATDFVLHIYNVHTGTLTNTGLEASGALHVSGRLLAWTVFESRQGMTDLNGDGDTNDFVLHLADMSTGTTTNIGFASSGYAVEGNQLAFVALEQSQGMTDLNGDGDAGDSPLHLYDVSTGLVTNVEVDAAGGFEISGDRVAFGVWESRQGNTDLNADGDSTDVVMHLYDADSESITNLELATADREFHLDGDLLAFTVLEQANGSTDANGDGDTADHVLHAFDAATDSLTNLGLAVEDDDDFQVTNGRVAFAVSEAAQGTDVNGDGDAFDEVVHLYETSVSNLGFAIEGFQLDGEHLAFAVREFRHFVADLNGDGDTADLVLHLYDVGSATTTNLETDAELGFKLNGDMLLAFGARETNQGGDGNGDGDTSDFTLYVFDISSGNLINLQADPSGGFQQFQVSGPFVSFGVQEFAQGATDLNGDGDANDIVLHYFDVVTGGATNVGDDVTLGHQLQSATIAYAVTEARQGMTDLNGDGDALDVVLHVAELVPSVMSPGEMIEALIAHLDALDLPRGVERRGTMHLEHALEALERDDPCLAIRFLRIFTYSVENAGRRISEDDAADLTQEANEILQLLRVEHPECHGRDDENRRRRRGRR